MKPNQTSRCAKRGFSLIEIIVAMAILGILAVMALGNYKATQKKSRDMKRKSDLVAIAKSLEVYYQDFGRYPAAASGRMQACGAAGVSDCPWGTGVMENQTSTVIYMPKIPNDPGAPGQFYYYAVDAVNFSWYRLYAHLENTDDSAYHAEVPGTTCYAAGAVTTCNYGTSSTNTAPY